MKATALFSNGDYASHVRRECDPKVALEEARRNFNRGD
jgi:hypothetical protein